jgi:hypothetical protein
MMDDDEFKAFVGWLARKAEIFEENMPSSTVSTKIPTWLDPDSNQDRGPGKLPNNHLGLSRNLLQELMFEIYISRC